MTNKEALLELGFTDKEVRIYLALLEMGKETASEIARQAGIQRTTAYNILNILAGKGLVRLSGREPKTEYVAESPDKITELLKEQTQEIQEKLKKATKLVPQLKSAHKVGERPKIKFYEGKQGLIEVYEDTLTSHETIRAYATVDEMHKALPGYFPEYYRRRTKKGVATRGIIPKTDISLERTRHNKEELRTSVFVPADKYYFSPEINIYDNKIMIASWREKLGIIIESAEIADAMKKIYELAWQGAKKLDEKKDR
ncbi:MAG: helix-turn-helix domain-containing protein [Candidatus Pacebacteria bacterium]|nr:helix-turn-helix domain-containing protein [Candidatus Paceibacterota bacterium]